MKYTHKVLKDSGKILFYYQKKGGIVYTESGYKVVDGYNVEELTRIGYEVIPYIPEDFSLVNV